MSRLCFREMGEQIRLAQNIAISGHINPDGDCLGAILGLGLALKDLGKEVDMIHAERPLHFSYLPGFRFLTPPDPIKGYDLFIMVDLGDKARLGPSAGLLDRSRVRINFDHHQTNEGVCDWVCQIRDASSTCEILASFLRDQKIPISKDAATALLAGIITDSNRFLYDTARARCMRVAADLIEAGADVKKIYLKEYQAVDPHMVAFTGHMVEKAAFLQEGRVALGLVSQEDLAHFQLTMPEAEGVVDQLRNLQGVELAVIVKEQAPKLSKLSLRSKRFFNVEALASSWGGGGHMKAAGASLAMPAKEAYQVVKEALEGYPLTDFEEPQA